MKYIDAEKLKKYLTDRYEVCPINDDERHGRHCAIIEIRNFIDFLQQEQSDFPTTDEQMKEFLATHPKIEVPEKYKNPDWLFKKQKQQEVDLEKALNGLDNAYFDLDGIAVKGATYYLTVNDLKDIARDFYELGLNASRRNSYDTDS